MSASRWGVAQLEESADLGSAGCGFSEVPHRPHDKPGEHMCHTIGHTEESMAKLLKPREEVRKAIAARIRGWQRP